MTRGLRIRLGPGKIGCGAVVVVAGVTVVVVVVVIVVVVVAPLPGCPIRSN